MKASRSLILLSLGFLLVSCGKNTSFTHVKESGAQTIGQSAAKAPFVLHKDSEIVKDQYIVVLKESSTYFSSYTSDELIKALSLDPKTSKIKSMYKEVINGFSATLSKEDVEKLRINPNIGYIEQNVKVKLFEKNMSQEEINNFYKNSVKSRGRKVQNDPPSWGLDRVDQRDLPLNKKYIYNTRADDVSIYILDTGIYKSHFDLKGRVRWGINTTNDGLNIDCNGHGTHVAGTAAGRRHGIARDAQLVAVKVLDCSGGGTLGGVLDGIEWAAIDAKYSGGPAVANMSFGGLASKVLDEGVTNSIQKHGVTFVAAAGNGFPKNSCDISPARVPGVLTVASSDIDDKRSAFSSGGECVDLFAPGHEITSAWIGNRYAQNTLSGTSMAAPHVTGAVALLQAHYPNWGPAQLHDAIIFNSTKGVIKEAGDAANRLLFTAP